MKKIKEFLKSFFITKDFIYIKQDCASIKYNLIFMALFCVMMYLTDIVITIANVYPLNFRFYMIFRTIPMLVILPFANFWLKIFISLYIFIVLAINTSCMLYFNSSVSYDVMIQTWHNFVSGQFVDDCIGEAGKVFPWILFLIIPGIFFFTFTIVFRNRFILSCLGTILMIIISIWHINMSFKRSAPRVDAFKNNRELSAFYALKSVSVFFTHYFFEEDIDFSKYNRERMKITLKNPNSPRVIVMVWGESYNADDFSLINKQQRETTPELEKFTAENKSHVFYNSALSGASTTNPSTDLFFSLQNQPGPLLDIIKDRSQNLFDLARKNGYKTYWISSQSDELAHMARINKNNADYFISRENRKYKHLKNDDHLIEELRNIDTSTGKHFIVLNTFAVHSNFDKHYTNRPDTSKYDVYNDPNSKTPQRDKYHNAIRYVENVIAQAMRIAKEKDADYFVITSDHGEDMSDGEVRHERWDHSTRGHVFPTISATNVPFIVYSKQGLTPQIDKLLNKKMLKHADISKFVANLLGYDVEDKYDEENVGFLYMMPAGDYSMIRVELVNGKREMVFRGVVSDYIKKYWLNNNKDKPLEN